MKGARWNEDTKTPFDGTESPAEDTAAQAAAACSQCTEHHGGTCRDCPARHSRARRGGAHPRKGRDAHGLTVDGVCGAATYGVLSGGAEYDPVALGIREERTPEVSRGGGRALYVSATAYSAHDPGNGNRTATGTMVRRGVIAVDPSVIPLGTHVFIPGYGEAVAEDIGGSIHGNRIDVAFDTHAEALMFGRQDLEIFIME